MERESEKQLTTTVAVIGGGLVGAINACFLAKRGFQVDLYERRKDIRKEEHVQGRSINMALSVRGREALRRVGLEDTVTARGIPMRARMIHDLDGSTHPIPYGKKDQYIMSISRRKLNEIILDGAEKYPNVKIYFDHKLQSVNFETGKMKFESGSRVAIERKADLICGADGAYSVVRREMMKYVRMDFSQQYIPHGYMELCIPATADNQFAMGINYLHIWPRNEFMMIALPNMDKTYTCTLFMPFDMFESIKTDEDLLNFYKTTFPDSLPLLGEESLKKTFFGTTGPLPLVTVKCSPYNIGGKAVLLGDAAHAMVPFYGQGMNAGFEDCTLLDDILERCNNNLNEALPIFDQERNEDAKAICDLALYNYIEMRKSVNSKLFRFRKKLDNLLHWLFPKSWIPLYTMVSFSRIRYSECISRRAAQDKLLSRLMKFFWVCAASGAIYGYLWYNRLDSWWRLGLFGGRLVVAVM